MCKENKQTCSDSHETNVNKISSDKRRYCFYKCVLTSLNKTNCVKDYNYIHISPLSKLSWIRWNDDPSSRFENTL